MLKKIHIAHITGAAEIQYNGITDDSGDFNRPARSIDQMFFKPYKSPEEFIFCASNTLRPLKTVALALLYPPILVIMPVICSTLALGFLLAASISNTFNNEKSALSCMNIVDISLTALCQYIINLIVLPIALLFLLTRSISTGLQAAGIYDHDASPADALPAPAI